MSLASLTMTPGDANDDEVGGSLDEQDAMLEHFRLFTPVYPFDDISAMLALLSFAPICLCLMKSEDQT